MIQKIREASGLLTTNWVLFSSIVLTVWLPGSILLVYLRLYVFPEATGGDEFRMLAQELRVSNAIELAFGPIYVGAILHAASRLKQGLRTTYGESMSHAARKSFKLLGTRIGTGLIVLAGFIALIIPGVVLALRFALVDAVVVLENVEGKNARNLSARLTQGKRWNILGTIVLTLLGVVIAISLISFILYLPLSLVGQDENFVIAVISECINSILLVLPIIVLFLFYWDAKNQQTVPQQEDNQ
ncbi:MAG: hypothetical protein KME35_08815 [Aphanocapsa sp. GSE-SYN-MK-11-07L]|jgi:hypothetical protein|nr:hypothetical protein [Aphanocapsa sp. GSE-SYN-MK-11-07L]